MDRTIACFSVPHFEIALVRLIDPSLRARPLAVVESTATGPALRDVSAEASADGVVTGMSARQAIGFCRGLVLVPHSPGRLRRGRECLWRTVAEHAPVWEPAKAGKVYAEFTGTGRLFGEGPDVARHVVAELYVRHGLKAAAGIGTNKLVSHIAVQLAAVPSLCDVPPGDERRFVAPLPPTVLPQAARPAWRPVLRALDDLNLRRLGAVAEVTVAQLRAVIGPAAAPLHRCANGLDDRAVVPAAHRPSVAFVQSLGSGMIEPQRIAGLCYGMLETLCGRLRASGQACSLLRVTATYADYREAVSTVRPVEPSQWEYSFASGIEAAVAGAAARRVRIRCVALEGHTTPVRPSQLSLPLGDHSSEHMQAAAANRRRHISGERTRELLSALGAIRLRFGDPAITWGGVPRLPVPA